MNSKSTILKNIIEQSNLLNILLFNKSYDDKWNLKPIRECITIIENTRITIHKNLCTKIEILHSENNFKKAREVLKYYQKKLYQLIKLKNLLVQIGNERVCIIEEFSNNDD